MLPVRKHPKHALAWAFLVLAALAMAGCTGRATPGAAPTASPAATAASPAAPASATPATATPVPAPVNPTDIVHSQFPAAGDRDLYRLASQLASPPGAPPLPRVANSAPVAYAVGRKDNFWLVDLTTLKVYQPAFELRLVSPHAYWYIEDGLIVAQGELERSAAAFEAEVYPRVTAAFGVEQSPGVDNDTHISIINGRLRGVGGYVIAADGYTRQVYPYSNQREAVYINASAFPIGSSGYLSTVAHELQHLVHWNSDPTEETWVNEGLSELAATISGTRRLSFGGMGAPQVSLVHWTVTGAGAGAHYEGASLFAHYLWEHYTRNNTDLALLVRQPENGTAGIDAYLRAQGYPQDFRQVFQDWVVANFLDEPEGPYGYRTRDVQPRGVQSISGYGQFSGQVPQYAAHYVELKDVSGPLLLYFEGAPEAALLPVDAGQAGCWWSNSGDSISSTLTRSLDLTGVTQATLTYQVWHQIEQDWDYAYLQASTDDGQTWTVLETAHTTRENPLGISYGPAYTGNSQGWLDEQVSLNAFAGRRILLRFQYVTDDGANAMGLCLRRIAVPEAGLSGDDRGWQADGFLLTGNRVAQDYLVQVMEMGAPNRVTRMILDDANQGELALQPPAAGRLIVAVAALAPKTRELAPYSLIVEPAR